MEPSKSIVGKKAFVGLMPGFCLVLFILSTYAPFANPDLRYIKYGLFVVPLIIMIGIGKLNRFKPLSSYLTQNLFLYIFLFIISFLTIIQDGIYVRFFNEIFLVLCPLLFVFLISFFYVPEKKEKLVRVAFWGILGTYLLEKGSYLLMVLLNPQMLINALRTSTIDTESGLSFLFGMFLLYNMMERRWKFFWLSLILCILSFKRITLVGIVLCFVFWFLFRNKEQSIGKRKVGWSLILVLGNLVVVWILFQLISGRYDSLIGDYTGLSTNLLLMGRYNLYNAIMSIIGDIKILGIGFGKTADILEKNGFVLLNLHSDILKHFLEFGPLLFSIWIYFFFFYNLKNLKLFVLALFLNVLFLSDNVFIYFEVMFLFYFFAMLIICEGQSRIAHASTEKQFQ